MYHSGRSEESILVSYRPRLDTALLIGSPQGILSMSEYPHQETIILFRLSMESFFQIAHTPLKDKHLIINIL